jgi:23S rRNA (adenine2503-C2)-methyltransferase
MMGAWITRGNGITRGMGQVTSMQGAEDESMGMAAGNRPPGPTAPPRATLHDAVALEAFRRRWRLDPDRIRRMRYALYHTHESVTSALARLGDAAAAALPESFDLAPLAIAERHDSSLDGSSKFVLRAADGAKLETVLLRSHTGRTAACVSTQVGCRAGCPFCATARMGLRRDLSGGEIVEQALVVARIARDEGRRLRNLVFMGMGEPLDNERGLHEAMECLLGPSGCHFPPRRLLVSTVGVPDAMRRLIERFPGVQLALSLHSARPDLRAKLVPWSRKVDWQELREALFYVARQPTVHRHQGPVMIEHLLLEGVNDGPEDAQALIDYLQGIRVHVNLIPYNPVPHAPDWKPTARSARDVFAQRLRDAGLFTTIRYSMGADIQAACGQLVQR